MGTNKVIQIAVYQNRIVALLDNGDLYWREGIESRNWHKLDHLDETTSYIPEGTEDREENLVVYDPVNP